MPTFRYRAINEEGVVVVGEATAESKEALSAELAQGHLYVSQVARSYFSRKRPVSNEERLLFLTEFTALLRSGTPVPESIQVCCSQEQRETLADALRRVLVHLTAGASLADAFSQRPDVFEPLFITALKVGEKSGEMPKALSDYRELLERRIAIQRRFKQALVYPAFVLVMLVAIVSVLIGFSLPRFANMYADMGAQLPVATRILLSAFHALPEIGAVGLALFVLAIGLIARFRDDERFIRGVERVRLGLPVIGQIFRLHTVTLMTHTLHGLMVSGIAFHEAVRHTAYSLPSRYFRHKLHHVAELLDSGTSIVSALRSGELFPSTVIRLLEAGERSGTLEMQMGEAASYFENILEYRLSTVLALVEPILILVTGLIVGSIVLIMYLPVFGLAGAIS